MANYELRFSVQKRSWIDCPIREQLKKAFEAENDNEARNKAPEVWQEIASIYRSEGDNLQFVALAAVERDIVWCP